MGTQGSCLEANIALLPWNPHFKLYEPRWLIFTSTRALPPSRVIQSDMRDSLIVEGSNTTGAQITEFIVGMRSIVREGTVFNEVVMLGAEFYERETFLTPSPAGGKEAIASLGIGRGCPMERTIIDKNACMDDGFIMRANRAGETLQDGCHWIRDGMTVIQTGAIIPPVTEL